MKTKRVRYAHFQQGMVSPLTLIILAVAVVSIAATGYMLISNAQNETPSYTSTKTTGKPASGFSTLPLPTYKPISQSDKVSVIEDDLNNTAIEDFTKDSQELDNLINQI